MGFPSFASGDVLTATDMNAVGLWLVKTQTVGSAVASVEVSSAFSSTYDNYKIVYVGGSGSTWLNLTMQFGVGTTYTSSSYNGGAAYINVGGASWQLTVGATSSFLCGNANTDFVNVCLEVQAPNLAKRTFAQGPYARMDNGQIGNCWAEQSGTTQFNSFKISTSTGTLTGGTIRVYGYRN